MSVSVPADLAKPLAEAAAAIGQSQTIVLACHVNPDGDALGSLLGLALALMPLGKTLTCLSEDGVPDILKFLPSADLIQQATDIAEFDLALVVDSGDLRGVHCRNRLRPAFRSQSSHHARNRNVPVHGHYHRHRLVPVPERHP